MDRARLGFWIMQPDDTPSGDNGIIDNYRPTTASPAALASRKSRNRSAGCRVDFHVQPTINSNFLQEVLADLSIAQHSAREFMLEAARLETS
jgi:hypothetical protein